MNASFLFLSRVSFALLLMLVAAEVSAQASDSVGIAEVVDDYIVGWREADATLLERAFDMEAGVVLWVERREGSDRLQSRKLADLVQTVKPHATYGLDYRIESLQIIDAQLAVALVRIPRGESHYMDALELQKINGEWKIVLKSFVYFAKE